MSDTPPQARHVPVLRDRVLSLLAPALQTQGSVYVDFTLGMGGHAEAVLASFEASQAIGIDRDAGALEMASQRLAPFADRLQLRHAVFSDLADVLDDLHRDHYDAGLLDLGVSSWQLDEPDRGFAYRYDAPLDMRMDNSDGITAAEILNTYDHGRLASVLARYGEERFAGRIASAIVTRRESRPFASSADLVSLLREAIPLSSQRTSGHPAKRTFQALRIEVNGELEAVEAVLTPALDRLTIGGRLVVLSYHSLEDRLVKTAFASATASSAPRGLPVELPEHAPRFISLTRGAEKANADEVAANARAASVRLRAVERVR